MIILKFRWKAASTFGSMSPTGPYRLEVDHPAKRIVEYFNTPFDALLRHAEIESALSGGPLPQTKIN